MGGGRIFLKNLRDTNFNKDLSNEPNFAVSISLDGTLKDIWFMALKKVHEFPFSSRDVTNQTPPGQE